MGRSGKKGGKNSARKVRVEFRANRSRPSRVKDWTRQLRQGEEIEPRLTENVVAKGDLSRKRTVTVSDSEETDGQLAQGTVIALRGQFADVDDGDRVWPCTVRRLLRTRSIRERFPVTVGDRVGFRIVAEIPGVQAEGVIETVEPRRSELKRVSSRREQVIAANVDQILIVSSANQPPPKPHLIDRYIVAALAGRMTPVVCMNKIDLDAQGRFREALSPYQALGYRTVCTCALTGEGTDGLREVLRDRSTVLAGQSGVGKSSLLNSLQPGLRLRVGRVSDETAKGRHITSAAELLRLDFGAWVVDTPGIRSFDVSAVPAGELEQHFVEFVPFVADCKFPDCTHTHEGSCAVKQAVEDGAIHPTRYQSYARLFQERVEA
ncbi:MAG: ribosome small subunit-dependent GTPase A [Phycisphaerales bacterium]|nr:MAG: ribosome small subunit-dependent GTPase A [Phycisphaerales bacterium]